MKIVIQRVLDAHVEVDGATVGQIEKGLVVLVGIEDNDTQDDVLLAANKIMKMRIFDDADGIMNESIQDQGGSILSISQFTLAGDVRKGNRPSYSKAMKALDADKLYQTFNDHLRSASINVETGIFQTHMNVHLNNDGPVTIIMIIKDNKVVSVN